MLSTNHSLLATRILSVILLASFLCAPAAWSASHHPLVFLDKIKGSKNGGAQIVAHFCINCHGEKPLIPVGAPRIGVLSDWSPRFKQNLHVLFQHTAEGMNAMPARGGCFECSDEQLYLAISAMLPESLKQ